MSKPPTQEYEPTTTSSVPDPASYTKTVDKIMDNLFRWNEVVFEGQENIPTNEPLLIVANHRGYSDTPVLAKAIQPVGLPRFAAAKEVLSYPIIGKKMVNKWGAVSINRSSPSSEEILGPLEILEHDVDPLFAIFPETTRKKENLETIEKVPSLVGRIACYGGVRILPVGIVGSEKHRNLIGFSDIFVAIGEPFGPYPVEAGYDLQQRSLDRLTGDDRKILRNCQSEIKDAMQLALDDAYILAQKNGRDYAHL